MQGITIRERTDDKHFDLRRLKAKSKVLHTLVRDFLIEDDCALALHRESEMYVICLHTFAFHERCLT